MTENKEDFLGDSVEIEVDSQKNKYITFSLGEENYAVAIKKVAEIIGIQKISKLPDMPAYVKGAINLRGAIIPIVDLRIKFKMPEIEYNSRTCIIVVKLNDSEFGLIVDEVSEVLDIPPEAVDDPTKGSTAMKSKYISGVGKVRDEIVIILDIDKALSEDEREEIEKNI